MPTRKPLSFEGVHQFLRTLFAEGLPARRVLSLAEATFGWIESASLAVAMIGQGLALAQPWPLCRVCRMQAPQRDRPGMLPSVAAGMLSAGVGGSFLSSILGSAPVVGFDPIAWSPPWSARAWSYGSAVPWLDLGRPEVRGGLALAEPVGAVWDLSICASRHCAALHALGISMTASFSTLTRPENTGISGSRKQLDSLLPDRAGSPPRTGTAVPAASLGQVSLDLPLVLGLRGLIVRPLRRLLAPAVGKPAARRTSKTGRRRRFGQLNLQRSGPCVASGKDIEAAWPQVAFERNMAIKRGIANSKFGTQLVDPGAGMPHGGLDKAKHGNGHLLPAVVISTHGIGIRIDAPWASHDRHPAYTIGFLH